MLHAFFLQKENTVFSNRLFLRYIYCSPVLSLCKDCVRLSLLSAAVMLLWLPDMLFFFLFPSWIRIFILSHFFFFFFLLSVNIDL